MKPENQSDGFSLLEVLIAMVMVAMTGLLICTSLINSQKSLQRSRLRFEFQESVASSAAQTIGRLQDPAYRGSGESQDGPICCRWQVNGADGLLCLDVQGEYKSKGLFTKLTIFKSAWLARMGDHHE